MSIQRAKPIRADIPPLTASDMPTGSIIQTVRGEEDDIEFHDTEGTIMSASITPLLSDSNLLISVYVQWSVLTYEGGDWGMQLRQNSSGSYTTILGDSQNSYLISGGGVDASDNPLGATSYGQPKYYVRSASKTEYFTGRTAGTSAFTVELRHEIGQQNCHVRYGRDGWGGNGGESQRSLCSIIVHEIAA